MIDGGLDPYLQKRFRRCAKAFLTLAAFFPILFATHWLFDNGYGEAWFLASIVLTFVYAAVLLYGCWNVLTGFVHVVTGFSKRARDGRDS